MKPTGPRKEDKPESIPQPEREKVSDEDAVRRETEKQEEEGGGGNPPSSDGEQTTPG